MSEVSSPGITSSPDLTVDETSLDDCKKLCTMVSQCQAMTYINGKCVIHTSTTTASSVEATGYTFCTRTTCPNGSRCCFSEQANKQGSSPTSKVLEGTVESCKAMCLHVASCKAVTTSGINSCSFFTSTFTTNNVGGSAYFSKSCSGADTSTLTIENVCSATETNRLSKLLGIWCIMIFTDVI
ncbi:uncharacterized protein LOC143282746 [Babylonia areolata]|uniref:uncharacterized protein LOC143282746 n=1 Tax=Babylonia areolata TaxID=304850 RepID=UPI003FD1EEFF